jgi:exonuclease III
MLSLDIMSSNAGSLSVNNRIWGIQHFMREQAVDILAVQETHLSTTVTNSFTNPGQDITLLAANGTSSERGVAIFFNSSVEAEEVPIMPLTEQIPELNEIESGRLQIAKIKKGNIQATVINVYAPNLVQNRRIFFNTLSHIIPLLEEPFILTGDWNCVENAALDRSSGTEY